MKIILNQKYFRYLHHTSASGLAIVSTIKRTRFHLYHHYRIIGAWYSSADLAGILVEESLLFTSLGIMLLNMKFVD